ncbi:hypothetical protein KP509_29G011000 [Ceratopteris richardii]|uniref:Glycosyltransferase n=1 Tax=Ceratopteris richardii TaxID=49495 RepID=A0A8T2R5S1_CERRI|nr:hypothetical protein KP509_29G011000 [Ceratopteris richardii]
MMVSSQASTPHAVVVSSNGEGHINFAVRLSGSLTALGFHVSFIYFSSYYAKLRNMMRLVLPAAVETANVGDEDSIEQATAPGILRVRILEDGYEPGDVDNFFLVTPTMKENLLRFVTEDREEGISAPTCIVSDTLSPWTLEVAQRVGIPRVEFWASNAISYLVFSNLDYLYSKGIFPEKGSPTRWKSEAPLILNHIQGLPEFPSELLPQEVRFGEPSDPFVQVFLNVESCAKYAERIFINSLTELEPTAFNALKLLAIPAYGVGPLPNPVNKLSHGESECLSWLDSQSDNSVVYVAFGSFATLSTEEMHELAFGLDASECPFLWVIREDICKREEVSQVLPKGFLERIDGKGLLVSWAPQVQVLAHRSVGGFLSHCGWNSIIESLAGGVPLLSCPRMAEQRLNCHWVCQQWGVGVEMMRTDTGGLERNFVEIGIKALLHGTQGSQARSKAQEIMSLIAQSHSREGGTSVANLEQFYDDMRVVCSKTSKSVL